MEPNKSQSGNAATSNNGGRFLQGVWMSRCEGGRIERLTKWSDGKKDERLGSLDKAEHSSMVRMNLQQLEVRDELAYLKKSKRLMIKASEPDTDASEKKHMEVHSESSSSSSLDAVRRSHPKSGTIRKEERSQAMRARGNMVHSSFPNNRRPHFVRPMTREVHANGILPTRYNARSAKLPSSATAYRHAQALTVSSATTDKMTRSSRLRDVAEKRQGESAQTLNGGIKARDVTDQDSTSKPTRKVGRMELNPDIIVNDFMHTGLTTKR